MALVVERELDLDVAQVMVPDARAAMAPLAARFWGDPTAELQVVGSYRDEWEDDHRVP